MELSMELALIRWSVVHIRWHELASGHVPHLAAFLAGWNCRCIGSTFPEDPGPSKASIFHGWKEADEQIAIESR